MLSLVVGLGNVGEKYRLTRHNLGFRVVENVLGARNLKLKKGPAVYDRAETEIAESRIVFAMPKTSMNRSGLAARALLQLYEIDADNMLVVVDDVYLPLGHLRIRAAGSDGGHNGLASVIEELKTENFPRLRLGIGPLPDDTDLVEFVLGDFEQNELAIVDKMIAAASDAVLCCLEHGLEEAMSRYNQNPA